MMLKELGTNLLAARFRWLADIAAWALRWMVRCCWLLLRLHGNLRLGNAEHPARNLNGSLKCVDHIPLHFNASLNELQLNLTHIIRPKGYLSVRKPKNFFVIHW